MNVDDVINYITSETIKTMYDSIPRDCIVTLNKYYELTDLRFEIHEFIHDRFYAAIDNIIKFIESASKIYETDENAKRFFFKLIYLDTVLSLLMESSKVSMDVSIRDFIYACNNNIDTVDIVDYMIYSVATYVTDKKLHDIEIDELGFVIDRFLSDYISSIRLLRRKKRRNKYLNLYFMERYGLKYKTAADIFVYFENKLLLYNLLVKLMEEKKSKYISLPESVISNIETKSNYCKKEWIENAVEQRRKVLVALSRISKKYTNEYIDIELEKYRDMLKKMCSMFVELEEK